jgi:hypothetical protein
MEHFIIGTLLVAFAGLLVSRIHFHFSFNLQVSRSKEGHVVRPVLRGGKRGVRAVTVPPPVSIRPSQDEADLVSALLNLGCEKGKALKVARAAMGQGVDFDSRVKWAVQNAA